MTNLILALAFLAFFPAAALANPPNNWVGAAWVEDKVSINGKIEVNESMTVRGSIATDSAYAAFSSTIPIEALNSNVYVGAGISGEHEEYVRKDGDQLELLNRWDVSPMWLAGVETKVGEGSVVFGEVSGSDRAQGRVGLAIEF